MMSHDQPHLAFVTHKLTSAGGGVSEVIRCLSRTMVLADQLRLDIYGLKDASNVLDTTVWEPAVPTLKSPTFPEFLGHVPSLSQQLLNVDLVHSHGLWKLTSRSVRKWHRETQRPYVVSPHGMLHPLALRQSSFRKRIASLLWERSHLSQAACLHALCEPEAQAIRDYGCRNPICIIPNGVDGRPLESIKKPDESGKRTLLYLGRLHRDKGLVPLLQAWPQFVKQAPEWKLDIVGWDDGGHREELERYVDRHVIGDSVRFLGPKFGDAKMAAYEDASAVILPSSFEALPMVILEAWSYATPVLMTDACNLDIGFTKNAAIRITADTASILEGLNELSGMSPDDLEAMQRAAHALVRQHFTWSHVASKYLQMYNWIRGVEAIPQFCFEVS